MKRMQRWIKTEIIATAVLAVILGVLFFIPPQAGVADNGDFDRLMFSTGIRSFDRPDAERYYDYANFQFQKLPGALLSFGPYVTTHLIPVRIAQIFQPGLVFDTRVLAVVYSVLLLWAIYLLIKYTRQDTLWKTILFAAAALWILGDSTYTVYFNSFYGEAASYTGLLLMAGFGLMLCGKKMQPACLFGFFLSAFYFFGSKLQYALLSVLLLLFLIPLYLQHRKLKKPLIAGTLAVVLLTGTIYFVAPSQLGKDTLYNSVFYGILKDSPDPAGDLQALGLPPEFIALAGTHAYVDNPPLDVKSDSFDRQFYQQVGRGTVIKFYLTHPSRLIEKLQLTTRQAFDNQLGMMGNFRKQDGLAPGENNTFYTSYNSFKAHVFPQNFWVLFGYYVVYFTVLLLLWVKKRGARSYIALLFFLMVCGIAQFPLPILGNGEADIAKQLFIFNATFDLSLLAAFWFLLRCIPWPWKKEKAVENTV